MDMWFCNVPLPMISRYESHFSSIVNPTDDYGDDMSLVNGKHCPDVTAFQNAKI